MDRRTLRKPLIWSVFGGSNVLDYIDRPLQTPDGTPVTLTRSGLDFVVTIDGQIVSRTSDNAQTCYVLNQAEVGLSV